MAGAAPTEVVPAVVAVRVRGGMVFFHLGERVTIIDAGPPGSAHHILASLHALGRAADEVGCIVITHAHIDHVGGLPALQRLIPAPAAAHEADAEWITRVDPLPNPFQRRPLAVLSEPFLRGIDPGPARIDVRLADGDAIPGAPGLRTVHLPGHTAGSIAVHATEQGVVWAGDAMEYRGHRLTPPSAHFTQDMPQARESIRSLARLDFETLCLSHFPAIRYGASRVVRAFADRLGD